MKKIIIAGSVVYILLALTIFVLLNIEAPRPDPLVINSIVHEVINNPYSNITYDLTIMLTTEMENISQARQIEYLQFVFFLVLTIMFLCLVLFALYFYKQYIAPFKNLKNFAAEIAMGNLDIQLKMQKNNPFGSFTESFDIMRQELKLAHDRETKANKAKYELVAKMSHDIRTPIASSLSTIDVMGLRDMDAFHKNKLTNITDQLYFIETLASNMFNATLEELAETKTNIQKITTIQIEEMIKSADPQQYIEDFSLPSCIVNADIIKLQQVLSNVVSNSYKYAGTNIAIQGIIHDGFLNITIADNGPGIKDYETELVFNKYYRSEDTKEKEGYGLGLYIAKHFMKEMEGDITVFNQSGLLVNLKLNLTKS